VILTHCGAGSNSWLLRSRFVGLSFTGSAALAHELFLPFAVPLGIAVTIGRAARFRFPAALAQAKCATQFALARVESSLARAHGHRGGPKAPAPLRASATRQPTLPLPVGA
jgi:hypothetical protein